MSQNKLMLNTMLMFTLYSKDAAYLTMQWLSVNLTCALLQPVRTARPVTESLQELKVVIFPL